MGAPERFLEKLAAFQHRHSIIIVIISLIFTVFMVFGIFKLTMQTDIYQEMPQDLPIFKLNDRIKDKFGGQDAMFVIVTIDEKREVRNGVQDIRDPEVINYLINLENELSNEGLIDSVVSAGTVFQNIPVTNLEQTSAIISSNSALSSFFSSDYKTTMMLVRVDVGGSDKKTIAVTNLLKEKVDSIPKPGGVRVMITGNPAIRVVIFDLLKRDAIYTITLASIIILFVLFFMEKSITKGAVVFIPLFLGLLWTMGTMGWLGLKLSIATVGLGAMILGLGVEYGAFMLTRYLEERHKGHDQLSSITVSVPAVGMAIIGSGTTTMVGFFALCLSVMPMLQHLGLSLGLGITYALFAAVFIAPAYIILEDSFEVWLDKKRHSELTIKLNNHKRKKK